MRLKRRIDLLTLKMCQMKKWFLVLFVLFLAFDGYTQSRSINKFYRQHRFEEGVRKVKLPGWLIRLGTRIGQGAVDSEEDKELLKMARKKLRKMRMLIAEEGHSISKEKIDKLMKSVKKKDRFDQLIYVRDKETEVNMMVRTKGDMIRNLLVLVNEEDEFIMVSLKTKLGIQDINKLLKSLPEDVDVEVPIHEPVPEPEPEILAEEPEV